MSQTKLTEVLDRLRKLWAKQAARDLTDRDLLDRFLADRDDPAFAVLVQRHGPMVFSVCQRVLGDANSAEDAFQATFLVLVRRAGSIRGNAPLGNWLFGVAQRVAMRARARDAIRRRREHQVFEQPAPDHLDEQTWLELRGVLDEEIGRLPLKYRAPVVLCYLEGKTREGAALELGCPKSSLNRRLARALELLRGQLTHRGLALSAAALATALGEKAAGAPVSTILTSNTIKAAAGIATGHAAASAFLSARAMTLAEETMKGMFAINVKVAVLLIALLLAIGGVGLAGYGAMQKPALTTLKEGPATSMAQDAAKDKQPQGNEAEKLYRAMEKKLAEAKSLKVVWEGEMRGDQEQKPVVVKFKGILILAEGDKARIEFDADYPGQDMKTLVVSDGVDIALRETGTPGGRPRPVPARFSSLGRTLLASVGGLMTSSWLRMFATKNQKEEEYPTSEFRMGAKEKVGKTETQVVEFTITFAEDRNYRVKLWIDSKTSLPVKRQIGADDDKALKIAEVYNEFTLNRKLDAKLFVLPDADDDVPLPAKGKPVDKSKAAPGRTPDLYGDPLPEGAVARLGTIRFRPGLEVHAVAFAPDGKVLASGGGRAFGLSLWDAENGRPLYQTLADASCSALAFSPDGKLLLTGEYFGYTSLDARLRLMDIATGKQLRRFKTPDGIRAWCVAFSPDGKIVAAAQRRIWPGEGPAEIFLWDAETGNELRHLKGHGDGVTSIAFSPDGKTLASSSLDKTVRLWDVATGKETRRLEGHEQQVFAVAFAPRGKILASAEQGLVRLWDLETGKILRQLDGSWPLVFSADGKLLATGGPKATIGLWDAETWTKLRAWTGGTLLIRSLAFSPDGKVLASAGVENAVRRWDTSTGKEILGGIAHTGQVRDLQFAPDGKVLFSFAGGQNVLQWNLATGKAESRQFHVQTEDEWHRSAHDLSLHGKMLAVAGFVGSYLPPNPEPKSDPVVRLWDAVGWKELLAVNVHGERIGALKFSPDRKLLAAGGKDKIFLWDATTGKELHQLPGKRSEYSALAFSPDGKLLACEGEDQTIRLWDVATGKEHRSWNTQQRDLCRLVFSPDGKVLAACGICDQFGGGGNHLRLWAVDTGREVPLPIKIRVHVVAFSPSGRILATAGIDRRYDEEKGTLEAKCPIELWDLFSGKEIGFLDTPQETVESLAFSPDGRTLASGGGDSTILLWDMTKRPQGRAD